MAESTLGSVISSCNQSLDLDALFFHGSLQTHRLRLPGVHRRRPWASVWTTHGDGEKSLSLLWWLEEMVWFIGDDAASVDTEYHEDRESTVVTGRDTVVDVC